MNRKDIELAVKVDGQEGIIDHFPTKEEGLIYSGIECDNQDITTATWNYGTWSLDLNSEGPNKCVVTFKEGTPPSLSDLCASNTPLNECIDKHGLEVADMAEDTSMQHNLRYIGANPNNYVWW